MSNKLYVLLTENLTGICYLSLSLENQSSGTLHCPPKLKMDNAEEG